MHIRHTLKCVKNSLSYNEPLAKAHFSYRFYKVFRIKKFIENYKNEINNKKILETRDGNRKYLSLSLRELELN